MVNVNAVPNMMVWVILILAAFSLSWDRCMDDTTEQPMPSISPMAVIRSQNGEKMFTAANASLPTPCPMKTPSIIVIKEMQSMPKSVGISILPNSFGMLSEPKSIASLCICLSSKSRKDKKLLGVFM